MILSMAGNNAINRWKEGAGVPQSSHGGGFGQKKDGNAPAKEAAPPKTAHTYVTPTSEKFQKLLTRVAPLQLDSQGQPTTITKMVRPPLESRAVVEQQLQAARKRQSRLPLVDEAAARRLVPENFPAGPLPNWVKLMANFTMQGKQRIASQHLAETQGDLTPLLKAQLAWIVARQDRAWYALGRAKATLIALGQSDQQIDALDGDWSSFTAKERSLFTLARQLAASPIVLTDAEVAEAVKQVGPCDTVQAISFTTTLASFNRITEAAGLPLE